MRIRASNSSRVQHSQASSDTLKKSHVEQLSPKFEDNRKESSQMKELSHQANNNPTAIQLEELQTDINGGHSVFDGDVRKGALAHPTSLGNGVLQAKGFKAVNGKKPVSDESAAGAFADAGEKAWDSIFTDDEIDKKGGVNGIFIEKEGSLDAEAITKFEDPKRVEDAFALVQAAGDAPTKIKRWEQKKKDNGSVLVTPEIYKSREVDIKKVIAKVLLGKEDYSGEKPDLTDLDLEDDDPDGWIKKNEGIVDVLTEFLESKLIPYKGIIPVDVFELVSEKLAKYSPTIIAEIKQTLNLQSATPDTYEAEDTTLSMTEVVAHEFGHINAALQVSEKSVSEHIEKQQPDFATVAAIVKMLDKDTDPKSGKAPDRKLVTNLRFSFAVTNSNFHKINSSKFNEKELIEYEQLKKALPILANLLMSFEEFFNIQGVDNNPAIVLGSDKKKRISHGTEKVTGAHLKMDLDDEKMVSGIASMGADQMSQTLWLNKLKLLLTGYIHTFGEYFPK